MFGVDVESVMTMSGQTLYAGVFVLPFLQEDVAGIAAATASLTDMGPVTTLFATILACLVVSDVWKYWIGYYGRRNAWARRFAETPGVSSARDLVRRNLGKVLYAARFVPGARIPTYVACGFSRSLTRVFCILVTLTAVTSVAIMFALFHGVGAAAGEQAKYWLPAIAVAALTGYALFGRLRHFGRTFGLMTLFNRSFDGLPPDTPRFEDNPLEGEDRKA